MAVFFLHTAEMRIVPAIRPTIECLIWRNNVRLLRMVTKYDELRMKKSMMALIGACSDGAQQCNNVRHREIGAKTRCQSLIIGILGRWEGARPSGVR